MTKSIGYIFWGLLLVVLDFRINQFDVLPDFIGYILVAVGCAGLVGASRQFASARTSNWALLVMSVLELVLAGTPATILAVVQLVINCVMMQYLLGGFMDISMSVDRPDLASRASTCRGIYILLIFVTGSLSFIGQGTRDVSATLVIPVVLIMLVLVAIILNLIHNVKLAVLEKSGQTPYAEMPEVE